MTVSQTEKIAALASKVEACLPGLVQRAPSLADELCYEVQPANLKQVCVALRDDPGLRFEILIDVAGIDYLDYATSEWKTHGRDSGFSRGEPWCARLPHDGARRRRLPVPFDHSQPAPALRARCGAPKVSSTRWWTSARRQLVRARGLRPVRILFTGIRICAILTDYGFIGHRSETSR
jgi:hypothetical protein